MKRFAWIVLLPLAAFAGTRDDYAQQWPLTLGQEDAGAYRVVLDRTVYRQLQSPTLKDLVVVNADGGTMAASLFDAEQPLAKPANTVDVPWFPLPSSTSQSRDIASISEIATDGSLRRVVMSDAGTATQASGNEYLIDTSRLREPVRALHFAWAAGQEPFDRPYRAMASDDLKNWSTVQEEGHLVELQNNGARIFKNRIELEGVKAKYLRLVPLQKDQRALSLTRVSAEFAPIQAAQDWQWEEIAGKRVVGKEGAVSFLYEIKGRFPFERADVALPGNSSNEWILKSRDSEESEWRFAAAPWMAFQLEDGKTSSRSPPQGLQQLNRDRYWQLIPKNHTDEAVPELRLGYRPEVVVFLAQGKAPYSLLGGSARGQRSESPLPQLVDALRAQRGQDWQPASATLGDMQPLAGAKALTPEPLKRDWKAWLLWALLVGGALIVAGFAFSLLKKPAGKNPD
ncbi:DUF3999 domain-containing protein [Pseudoxanthomonas sacheonensis]|uniref:DUF3999 domain-containing protein n=1 Tax=Pseudoxanthomonas sacheonensis TaxID=443615 RepID=A0ABU1RLZ7_9GAMM|nr:DUF3999 domain-containing protein [Pseudoxanthomonas sacheonensis]MDR6839799.1 hypothetical protein [Pseudoxanthomonas sacheonensis]